MDKKDDKKRSDAFKECDEKCLEVRKKTLSETFERTHQTYIALDNKAYYVTVILTTLFVGIFVYFLENFENIPLWKRSVLISIIPPFGLGFWYLCQALKGRRYSEGSHADKSLQLPYKQELGFTCEFLSKEIEYNSKQNTDKSRAVTKAMISVMMSVFIAIFISVLLYLLNDCSFMWINDRPVSLPPFITRTWCLLLAFPIGSALLTFFAVRHFVPPLKKDSKG